MQRTDSSSRVQVRAELADSADKRPSDSADKGTVAADDVPPHVLLDAKPVDRSLGRYDLAYEVDAGGFATLYLARTMGPGGFQKFVALKCIHAHLARNKEFVEMFLDEARIAVSVSHPSICPVFDFGEQDGVHYLAMDYILGESLSDAIPHLLNYGKGLRAKERHAFAAYVIASAAEGLHAAHEALSGDGKQLNVVHRDVSPTNIFVRYDGYVQLVDFGLASAADKVHQTGSGVAKGKVAYMAPEQFAGEEVDRRIDIWALGVVLYELLTGKSAFKRENDAKTMRAVLDEKVSPLWETSPDIPRPLDDIVSRMLVKDRDKRYQTALDVSDDLRDFLRNSPVRMTSQSAGLIMRELFPGRRELKLALIEKARRRETSPPVLPEDQRRARGLDGAATGLLPQSKLAAFLSPNHRGVWIFGAAVVLAISGIVMALLLKPQTGPVTRTERVYVTERGVSKRQARKEAAQEPQPTASEKSPTNIAGTKAVGFVHLNTFGVPAAVYSGGERIGRNNQNITLPEGKHQLEVRPDARGFDSRTLDIEVRRGEGRRLPAKLRKEDPAPRDPMSDPVPGDEAQEQTPSASDDDAGRPTGNNAHSSADSSSRVQPSGETPHAEDETERSSETDETPSDAPTTDDAQVAGEKDGVSSP